MRLIMRILTVVGISAALAVSQGMPLAAEGDQEARISTKGGAVVASPAPPRATLRGVDQVIPGHQELFAIKDGRLLHWGAPWAMPTGLGSGVTMFSTFFSGRGFASANAAVVNGGVRWWTSGLFGLETFPTPPIAQSGVKQVFANEYEATALVEGRLVRWDDDGDLQRAPLANVANIKSFSMNEFFGLAVTRGGDVYTWEETDGSGSGAGPVPRAVRRGVQQIAVGDGFALALKDGRVHMWGLESVDLPVSALSGVDAIAAGPGFGIALKNGRVLSLFNLDKYVISLGLFGYAGVGEPPVDTQANVTSIGAGGKSAAAIRNGRLIIWGAGATVPMALREGVTSVGGYAGQGVAVRNGMVVEWGFAGVTPLPESLADGGVRWIAQGNQFKAALNHDGDLVVWPWGETPAPPRVPPAARSGVTQVAIGTNVMIALKDGRAVVWEPYGAMVHTPLPARSGVTQVTVCEEAYRTTYVALKNGRVFTWGDTGAGRLNNSVSRGVNEVDGCLAIKGGRAVNILTRLPDVPRAARQNVTAVSSRDTTYAAVVDGRIVAWGDLSHDVFGPAVREARGVQDVIVSYWSILAIKRAAS
jgi:hypothetical protein